MAEIPIRLNGNGVTPGAGPRMSLLDPLRERPGLTGAEATACRRSQ
jgi:aerobic-type carbon monoxide dehydrogenase small subunit (CoxS/CutS family)